MKLAAFHIGFYHPTDDVTNPKQKLFCIRTVFCEELSLLNGMGAAIQHCNLLWVLFSFSWGQIKNFLNLRDFKHNSKQLFRRINFLIAIHFEIGFRDVSMETQILAKNDVQKENSQCVSGGICKVQNQISGPNWSMKYGVLNSLKTFWL